MRKLVVAAMLALSVTLLAGCSALRTPEPQPTREFVMPEFQITDWHDAPLEEFTEAFPDIDTTFLIDLPEAVAQKNGDLLWSIGSGSINTGFASFDTWARANYTITDDGDDRETEFVTEDDRLIKLSYRAMGDGVIINFFVSDEPAN